MRVRAVAFVLAMMLPTQAWAVSADVAARAQGRAEGSDRPQAIVLGKALLATVWPAQVLKVRVDCALGYCVAGIVISGTKFHGRLDEAGFLREVRSLITSAFLHAPIEEVDLWATVPHDAGVGAIVSGDVAQPTSRNVFAVTVRRADLSRLQESLRSRDVFWDAKWKKELQPRTGS